MKIISEYSSWYLLLCILFSLVFTILLYYNNKKYAHLSKYILWSLFTIRFLVLFVLSTLLLKPLIQYIKSYELKPKILVLHDNSESILLGKDSIKFSEDYLTELNTWRKSLSEWNDVIFLPFSKNIDSTDSIDFTGKQTNISAAIKHLNQNYAFDNVGAVILFSDGLYNSGANPIYDPFSLKAPLYTVALGDTVRKKDAYIQKLQHNKITFLNNSFPLEVYVGADLLKGKELEISLFQNGEKIESQKIIVNSDLFFNTQHFLIEAKKPGLQQYSIQITQFDHEITLKNNQQDFFIEVLDSRQKILVLASAPHPDISAIKHVLEKSKTYEVDIALSENFNKNIQQYGLIIWHQPMFKEPEDLLLKIKNSNIPVFYILGLNTNIQTWNKKLDYIKILNNKNQVNEVECNINEEFSYVTFSDAVRTKIKKFPPLKLSFGEYSALESDKIILHQKIASIQTKQPLLFFSQQEKSKHLVLLGEGLWRWKTYDYMQNGSFDVFEEFFSKLFQFLMVKENKNKFRVYPFKNQFFEDETILFEAQFYDDAYQLINSPDISLNVTNELGIAYPYQFQKNNSAYDVNIGFLPVGNYTYKASTSHNGKIFEQKGIFSVVPIQLEATQTVANHTLLFQMAQANNGKMYYPQDLQKLLNDLKNREDIQIEVKNEKTYIDVIEFKWLFYALVFLLSIEWFIKKYVGGY